MISNLIVIPLAFAILIAGIVYFAVSWIPVLENIIFTIFELLLTILNNGVKWIEQLPYSIYWGVSIHWYEVFWLYLIHFCLEPEPLFCEKPVCYSAVFCFPVLLLIFNVGEKFYLESTNELVIYNVNDAVAIDIFSWKDKCVYG